VAGSNAIPLDSEWEHVLAATPVDWRDPLGVERYEAWRTQQGKGNETVSETDGFATLNTVPAARVSVDSASLTVRESDWHPVAKRVDFIDHTILEVRELEYGVRELPPSPPAIASADRRVIPVAPPALPAQENAGEPLPAVDPDTAEVSLREALQKAGAGADEAPEITREGSLVRVRLTADNPARRQELAAALRGIAGTSVVILDPAAQTSVDASPVIRLPSDLPRYTTAPPLIGPLQDLLGGLDNANAYLHRVRDSYRGVLIDALSLTGLADRYSGTEWNRLASGLRDRLDRLAALQIDSLRSRSDEYLAQVSRALDQMPNPPARVLNSTVISSSACRSWRMDSDAVAENLRNLETAFQRLFVTEITDHPVTLSGNELLTESIQLRARFANEVSQFCGRAR
jgi:hypothetical protein